jgi:hypothetical protein
MGRTTCDPQQRCGNSPAPSWIACSENLESHSLYYVALDVLQRHQAQSLAPFYAVRFSFETMLAPSALVTFSSSRCNRRDHAFETALFGHSTRTLQPRADEAAAARHLGTISSRRI